MVSSQVEIASSSPFSCVFKDYNEKEKHITSNSNLSQKTQFNAQRNFKELVRNQFHPCISTSAGNSYIKRNKDNYLNGSHENYYRNNINENEETSSPMRKIHSRVPNQWSTKQAKDTVTTIEKQNQETEPRSLSKSCSISSRASSSIRDASPTPSDCSSTDIKVASLVQKWREIEVEAVHKQANINNGNMQCQSLNYDQNDSESREKLERLKSGSKLTINGEENTNNSISPQISSSHWEHISDEHEQHEAISSSIDGGERIKVSDIVKKWITTNQASDNEGKQERKSSLWPSVARLRIGMDIRDQRATSDHFISSPIVRGRQAIRDLFKRLEKDRYKEIESLKMLHVVSMFPKRSRIQALLRLRFLRREVHIQEQGQSLSKSYLSTPFDTSSSITNLRDRFDVTSVPNSITMTSTIREDINSNQHKDQASTSNQNSWQDICQKHYTIKTQDEGKTSSVSQIGEHNIGSECDFSVQTNPKKKKERIPDENMYTSSNVNLIKKKNTSHMTEDYIMEELCTKTEESTSQNLGTIVMNGDSEDTPSSNNHSQNFLDENVHHDIQECYITTLLHHNLEKEGEQQEEINVEHQDYDQQILQTNLDWVTEIARPRSYWEDCRQSRYQDMFNTRSEDGDIRQLLKRGSVSTVLASAFREKMDQLVVCKVQRANYYSTIIEENEDYKSINVDGKEDKYFRTLLKTTMPKINHQEIREQGDEEIKQEHLERVEQVRHYIEIAEENEDVEENMEHREEFDLSTQNYQDDTDYCDQTTLSSQISLGHYQDHETNGDCDHVPSTSSQQPPLSHSYYSDTHESSLLTSFSPIEKELIYDLRANMQHLYCEIFELRKSISTCMDMQVRLQHSLTEGVYVAGTHTDQGLQQHPKRRNSRKDSCCICYENKIDSLLYRCGHMCTCFNCASELQHSSEKCPICEAQILDIVRTYPLL